jgi:hypothetical protein
VAKSIHKSLLQSFNGKQWLLLPLEETRLNASNNRKMSSEKEHGLIE